VNRLPFHLGTRFKRTSLFQVAIGWLVMGAASVSFAAEPAGVWRGEWRSGSTGHHGPMHARIQPNSDGTYHARFTGRFALVIPFTYQTTLQPTYDAWGATTLTAEKPLGPVLGSYRMQAAVGDQSLHGSFQAAGDTGSIRMQRIR
jgi:hypothetical protein